VLGIFLFLALIPKVRAQVVDFFLALVPHLNATLQVRLMVQQKIQAFRVFASQLASQVVEQLCGEYEREMSTMWNGLLQYSAELGRVAQLLGAQLEREKKLHGVIEQIIGHSSNAHHQATMLAQQGPGSEELQHYLAQVLGKHTEIMNQTVGQANQMLAGHAVSANSLKQESITAEHEFTRIVKLLEQPLMSTEMPAPTIAMVPAPVLSATTPRNNTPRLGVGHGIQGAYATPPRGGALTPGMSQAMSAISLGSTPVPGSQYTHMHIPGHPAHPSQLLIGSPSWHASPSGRI